MFEARSGQRGTQVCCHRIDEGLLYVVTGSGRAERVHFWPASMALVRTASRNLDSADIEETPYRLFCVSQRKEQADLFHSIPTLQVSLPTGDATHV